MYFNSELNFVKQRKEAKREVCYQKVSPIRPVNRVASSTYQAKKYMFDNYSRFNRNNRHQEELLSFKEMLKYEINKGH